MSQVVTKPTHCREGQTPHILDLVMVNDESLVSDIEHFCPFGKSDHETLFFTLYVEEREELGHDWKYNLKKAQFGKMRKEFQQTDWNSLDAMEVEDCWREIKNKLYSSMEHNIPKINVKPNKKITPLWMNNKTIRMIKTKKET